MIAPKSPAIEQPGMLHSLRRLWHQLSSRRQRQFGLLLGLILLSAIAEMVSLGAVVPFIGALLEPAKLWGHPITISITKTLGITSTQGLVLLLTIVFILAAILAGGIRLLLLWSTTKLAYATGADLSAEVYKRALYLPYQVHLESNSSELISTITRKVDASVQLFYMTLTLISSVVLLTSILAVILAVSASIAITASITFGSFYYLISRHIKRRLQRNARAVSDSNTAVIKALQEGLGGIRDVLLDGTQPYYCEAYRRADLPLRAAMGENIFIAGSPRFVMEALGMVLIAILAYLLSREPGGATSALPILGALALGAQRLLPVLQQGFSAWVNIVGSHASLVDTLHFLEQPLPNDALEPAPPSFPFSQAIRFEAVRFRYGASTPWVLDGINLTIHKGSRIGFVGATGSGKSTLLDLLMGLMSPVEGCITVDGVLLNQQSRRAWQQTIAHVPQTIYLADATLAENIAFGIDPDEIDMARVREAARRACIADFIESRTDGYHAAVGERGVRLSGGQRQRIGIARALYKNATVLVFDEATSALDNTTEQEVMEAINQLDENLTVLIIAHRLSTVKLCETVIELGQGKVLAAGSYEELLDHSPSFRKLAAADGV